ncbi:MAG: LCP family protein [Clostridiales bacterium]|nr:LCP family protein [Clostridiales bacterium]
MESRRRGRHSNKKRMSKGKKIFIAVFTILLIAAISTGAYAFYILSLMKHTDINKPTTDNGITNVPVEDAKKINKNITNYALFGLDRRGTEASRSDTIMVLSLDKENKKIKLTSLMRDMYVDIPGHNKNKLNAAYAFGGPGLAINTINNDFKLDIQYYATVDFKGLQILINKLGGVDINVKQGEIQYLNSYLDELNKIDKSNVASHITKAGMQHLNGKQAVAYMRIRYYGRADYERTERQRTVLTQLFNKVKQAGPLKLPGIMTSILPYVETNLSSTNIMGLGASAIGYSSAIEQYRLPVDGTYTSPSIKGVGDVLQPDMNKNVDLLYKFIYGTDANVSK